MVICPDCGKDVKEAKFCSNCGARLPDVDAVVEEEPNVQEESVVEEPSDDIREESVVDAVVVDEPNVQEESVVEEPSDDIKEESPIDDSAEEEIKPNNAKKFKFCANCGTKVDLEAIFCPQCGYKFVQEEKTQTKFCQSCGEKININAEICPHCGVRVANFNNSSGGKSVLLSAILSFIFPGLGHLYIGLSKKGVSFIIAYIVSAILIFLLIGFVLIIIVWLWALIDSIKSTEAINRGEFVEDKLF